MQSSEESELIAKRSSDEGESVERRTSAWEDEVNDDKPAKFTGNINKGVPGHECGLSLAEHPIIRYINNGIFVEWRRKIKRLMMVSDIDRNSKALFKSTAKIRQEEQKHLEHYYSMIHPFSRARFAWEMMMISIYFAQLLLIPIEISTVNTQHLEGVVYANLCLDIVSFVDIVLFFRSGYHDKHRQKVIMNPKRVAIHYIKTYFFVDLMSSLPLSFVLHLEEQKFAHFWPFKLLMVFKLGRIPKMLQYLQKFCERIDIWSYNLKVLNFLICFLIFMMWAVSVQNLVREASFHDTHLLESWFSITLRFMQVGLAKSAYNHLDRLLQIIGLFLGNIVNMIILAQVIQIYNRRSSDKNKYNNLMQQINEYMKYKELPQRLRAKVFRYVNFKFQKHIFKETDILNTLSSILKDEILMHNCQKLVEKVKFFKDAPKELILRLVTKMKSEVYLPSDMIVQAGITGNAMYFIYMGSVAVYTSAGKEICHLHDGSHFGEIALVINEPRVATVIAIKDCEVFRLSRRDYQEAVSPFPEYANRIRRSALGRLQTINKMMDTDESSVNDSDHSEVHSVVGSTVGSVGKSSNVNK